MERHWFLRKGHHSVLQKVLLKAGRKAAQTVTRSVDHSEHLMADLTAFQWAHQKAELH
jgi:hypothetical protein